MSETIDFVRVTWCDISAVIRCKVIPSKRFYSLIANEGVACTGALMSLPFMYDACIGGSPVGEVQLKPIFPTLKQLPWKSRHGAVLTTMWKRDGTRWDMDPRYILERALETLLTKHSISIKAGFEIEFVLYKGFDETGQIIPVDHSVYAESSALASSSGDIIDRIVDSLFSQGIEVTMFHAESASGQFEVSLGYGDVLDATDNLIIARETIKSIAAHHNVNASFVPKIFPTQAGNSNHVHISLWKNGKNLTSPTGSEKSESLESLSTETQQFIAGILKHIEAISAVTMPSSNSYQRLADHCWSGNYITWGFENREAPVRISSNHVGEINNVEIKSFDGTANPYIGLGAIIFAGIDGLANGMKLQDPCQVDPATKKDELKKMPSTLGESIGALKNNQVIKAGLGEDFVDSFAKIRLAEEEHLAQIKAPNRIIQTLCNRY